MPTDPTRAQAVFLAAADLADPADRAAFLDRECAGDPTLRQRVEALLRAHDQPDSFLDAPIVPAAGGETRTQAPPELAETRTHGDGTSEDDLADALSVLAPPGRTDSLGRIGHYEVLEVLGRGGFGIVYRAFDDVLQRVVAVKVLAPSLATTSPARKRFLREARSSASVRHENVVQVHEVGEQPLPYLVMEFVPGETLQQRLDRTGPLDAPDVLWIGRQVAAGLAAAHGQGLIHRDIKPSNILIDSGPHPQVKITDFGLARAADDASLTRSGAVAGTPMYMAPEQARGEALDHRADLFSLGSVLYTMLTGRPPFRAGTTLAVLKRVAEDAPRPIREVIPEVPDWLCRIVEKLHAKDPVGRFQSAREVADLLANCEQQMKAHGGLRDLTRIPSGRRPARRRSRTPVGLIVLVLALVLGLPVVGLVVVAAAYFLMPIDSPKNSNLPPERMAGEQVVGPADPDKDGWEPLFNGTDLTGWKRHPKFPGVWGVEDGVLVGRGFTFLLSEREDYADFRLRAQMWASGGTGVYFRSQAPPANHLTGWVASTPDAVLHRCTPGWERVAADVAVAAPQNTWFTLEVIAVGDQFTIKVNEKIAVDYRADPATVRKGLVALHAHMNGEVRFQKIEIKELSASPGVPRRAADVLPFFAGTWRTERLFVEPKLPADEARAAGHTTYEYVADGKFLRGRGTVGGFETLLVYALDADKDVLRCWYASSTGAVTGPAVGMFNPDKRALLWMEKMPNGNSSIHEYEFVDANTIRTRLFHQDAGNRIVRDMRLTMTRVAGPVAGPGLQADPKRPTEMKILDRLTGEWRNEITAPAGGPDTKVVSLRVRAESILGGRFIEKFETNEASGASDYSLSWFDAVAKQYRAWFFNHSGSVTAFTGTWDEGTNSLTWDSEDGRLEGRWTFKGLDLREYRHRVKDKDGKVLTEANGVSRRAAPGWVQLFNGKDLTGWDPVQDPKEKRTAAWDVVEGVLVSKGVPQGLLRTRARYRAFHLRLDYRLTPVVVKGQTSLHSGLMWETPATDALNPPGMWMEFLKDARTICYAAGPHRPKVGPLNGQGGPEPADRWNKLELVCGNGRLQVIINGKVAVEQPGFEPVEGHLNLVSLGAGVHFRNIEIKELIQAAGGPKK